MKYLLMIFLCLSCNFAKEEKKKTPRSTIFIGIDVSGSFTKSKMFKDGMKFLGQYIHAHLSSKGGLTKPTDLYVGGIGGDEKEDPQSFFPVHDFKNKSPKEIETKLLKEFSKQRDNLTDFNTFFKRIKVIVKQKNLVLSPLKILMITDGVPEVAGRSKKAIKQAYSKITFQSLENLTRNVSVRILYANPKVGHNWRHYVPTRRVRIWSVEPRVMYGWSDQLKRSGEESLYSWIMDNVDLRIKSRGL